MSKLLFLKVRFWASMIWKSIESLIWAERAFARLSCEFDNVIPVAWHKGPSFLTRCLYYPYSKTTHNGKIRYHKPTSTPNPASNIKNRYFMIETIYINSRKVEQFVDKITFRFHKILLAKIRKPIVKQINTSSWFRYFYLLVKPQVYMISPVAFKNSFLYSCGP